jgi:DNA-binding GntR family transcriptional regulator
VRNRGYRVVPLGEQDRQEIHQMRSLLEIPSMVSLTGHAEVRRREAEFRSLAEDIVTAAGSGNVVGYLESDLAFHLGLLAILRNDRLVAAVRALRDQTRQLRLTALVGTDDLAAAARSHLDIVDALVSGAATEVARLMVEHLEHIRTDWHATHPDAKAADR